MLSGIDWGRGLYVRSSMEEVSMRWMSWLIGVAVFSILGSVALAESPLDGTEWRLEITPKGAEIPFYIDWVRFEDGNFTSVIFERKGFLTSRYTLTEKGDGPIVWEVKQKSETEGDLSWRGEPQEDAMTGTLRWTQADGTVIDHTLTGNKGTMSRTPEAEAEAEAARPPSK